MAQEFPEFFDRHMHEKPDVARGKACDFGDFLVRAVVLEFEPNDLSLIETEAVKQAPDALTEFVGVGFLRWVPLFARR